MTIFIGEDVQTEREAHASKDAGTDAMGDSPSYVDRRSTTQSRTGAPADIWLCGAAVVRRS